MTTSMPGEIDRCTGYRQAIQSQLDDDAGVSVDQSLEAHLSACEGCRAYRAEMLALRSVLRQMPVLALPAHLADVDRYTQPRFARRRSWRRVGASIAAVVVFGVAGIWWAQHEGGDDLQPPDTAQTWRDLERVMSLTGKALQDVQLVALREAVADPLAAAAETVQAHAMTGKSVQ